MTKSWLILAACILLFQGMARADSIFTTVFNVFESRKSERLLVLSAADGRIYKTGASKENKEFMNSLVGRIVKLDFRLSGKEALITNIRPAYPNEIDQKTYDLNHFQYNQLRTMAPTDLQSYEEADSLFKNLLNDGDRNRSQCFKRAHMWSYDMWSKMGVTSQKIFMFYTKRYQILEEFDWWFHVAPLVTVNGEDFVMDGTFMTKPTRVQEWKNYFLKTDKISCPEINTYQQFENNHWTRLCYLMKTPMYYFRPLDIENRDKLGEERNHWVLEELQDARRAFKNFEDSYEGLDTGKPTKTH